MKLSRDQVKALATAVDLQIPEKDLDNVTIRVSALLSAMEIIEAELGEAMNAVEPLPPMYPPQDL